MTEEREPHPDEIIERAIESEILVGKTIADRYRIDARIGQGGMGAVYRATQLNLRRTVAVKVIRPQFVDNDTAVSRFEREAHAVASLKHPNIITIYDFGVSPDAGMYIVMEYLAGRSLGREIAELKRIAPQQALRLAGQICGALDAAHNAGVVHRDLKPENVFLETTAAGPLAKILDFGIAKLRPDLDPVDDSLTNTNTMVGTPRYMSPEQIEDGPVDGRSDIYSLGCVLYEMLTGRPPFLASKLIGLVTQHVTRKPAPPSAFAPHLSAEVDRCVLRALAKAPADRYQTAGDFGRALAKVEKSLSESAPQPAAAAPAATHEDAPERAVPALVGRETELAALLRRLDRAIDGECQIVVVSGAAGVGKSRLTDELERIANERGVRVLRGRAADADLGIPYAAYSEAIQDYVRTNRAGLDAFGDVLSDLLGLFPALAEMTEVGTLRPDAGSATAEAARESATGQTSVFEILARAFARIARDGPVVVCLEDLHAAPGSVRALQYLASRLLPAPVLLVGTFRTTDAAAREPVTRLVEALRHERRFEPIALEPLSPDEQHRFVECLVGNGPIDAALAASLYEATDGNPYFTKELVQSLRDAGRIAPNDAGVWVAVGSATEFAAELPPNVRQAVVRRLDALPDAERDLLSMASVIGRRFAFRDLEMLAGADIDATVERLVDAGFLAEDRPSSSDTLTFTSGAMRESLYRSLARGRRRTLHRTFAERLEARAGGRLDRVLPELVHHYAAGDAGDQAVAHALELARRSLAAWNADTASAALTTALTFLDREGGHQMHEGEARSLLAAAHRMAGDYDGAVAELGGAVEAFARGDAPHRAVEAMVAAAEVAWEGRRVDAARRWVRRGTEAARALGDCASLAKLLELGATLANLRGEHDRARELLGEAERVRPPGVDTLAGASTTDGGLGSAGDGAVTAETSIAARRGSLGTLRLPYHSAVSDLDPCTDPSDMHAGLVLTVFETLTREGEGARIVPWLASEVAFEDGGRRLRIRLRDGVRFHDGRRLAARDVRHTFERVLAFPDRRWLLEGVTGAGAFVDGETDHVEGIRVVDDDELAIALDRPLAILPAVLTHSALAIVPDGCDRVEGTWRDCCVGTGPFRVTRFEPGRRLEQEANQDYWRAGLPRADRAVHVFGLSQAEILDGYRSGRYSVAWHLAPADVETLRQDPDFGAHLYEYPKLATYFVVFNTHRGPLADEDLRRRIVARVDVAELVRRHFGRTAIPARSLIPPGLLGYEPAARAAVRAAPAAESSGAAVLEAVVIPGTNEALVEDLSLAFAAEGFRLNVTEVQGEQIETACREASADLVISGWLGDYPDADAFAYPVLHTEAGFYGRFVGSAELDRLCLAGRSEQDAEVRHGIYRAIEDEVARRAVLLPFCHRQSYVFVQPDIDGVQLSLSPPFIELERLGFRSSRG